MPPAHKTSKEEILNAALKLAQQGGLASITARELGHRLNLSSRPIYSFYPSMEQLKEDVIVEISKSYGKALTEAASPDPFLNVGIGQLLFARDEPLYYGIMVEHFDKDSFMEGIFHQIKELELYREISSEVFYQAYLKMAIFTDGLALWLVQKRLPDSSDESLRTLLYEMGSAVLSSYRS